MFKLRLEPKRRQKLVPLGPEVIRMAHCDGQHLLGSGRWPCGADWATASTCLLVCVAFR